MGKSGRQCAPTCHLAQQVAYELTAYQQARYNEALSIMPNGIAACWRILMQVRFAGEGGCPGGFGCAGPLARQRHKIS